MPLLAAPILSSSENTLTLTHVGNRVLLKLFLVLLTPGLCILLKTNAVLVVELVGAVPQNFVCIVLPCCVQRGMLFTVAMAFVCYGIGTTVSVFVGAVSG